MLDKKVLLCVSGGIAAYKACDLASKLTQQGAQVKVIMTENAKKFVSPLVFQALTRNPVHFDTFDELDPKKIAHIDLADWAEIAIIAPATANVISKLAHGIADDMLTTTLLATRATIYLAPAMNVHMYQHPAVIENMQKLADWGYHFIEPGAGYLACGYVGKGRLEEPLKIIEAIKNHQATPLLFAGKKVLVSAGPTREKMDPVRFFTNHSTGKMGFAIAEAAAAYGADVTLVAGPTNLEVKNPKIKRINITTAEEMYEQMHAYFKTSDLVIKAAAVADYRPKNTFSEKMKKQPGDLAIEMERTKDILLSLGEIKENQFLVGFAAETNHAIENGISKLERKNLDAIVVNNVATVGAGFGQDTNIVTYINKEKQQKPLDIALKTDVAKSILQFIYRDLKDEKH